jgi:hypothetical protein
MTQRRVVVNGEVLVDETIVDGKPATKDAARRLPAGGEDLSDELREWLRRARERRPTAGGDADHSSSSSSSRHSHSRRVVVVNGETIVDEEIVDGEPRLPASRAPAAPDAESLLRDVRERVEREFMDAGRRRPTPPGRYGPERGADRDGAARAEASAEASASAEAGSPAAKPTKRSGTTGSGKTEAKPREKKTAPPVRRVRG